MGDNMDAKTPVPVTYKNWRGKTRARLITPVSLRFAATKFHPEPQWLLSALDAEDGKTKDFALKDCDFRNHPAHD